MIVEKEQMLAASLMANHQIFIMAVMIAMELTRFGGHRIIGQSMLNRRCPDATHPSGLPAGV